MHTSLICILLNWSPDYLLTCSQSLSCDACRHFQKWWRPEEFIFQSMKVFFSLANTIEENIPSAVPVHSTFAFLNTSMLNVVCLFSRTFSVSDVCRTCFQCSQMSKTSSPTDWGLQIPCVQLNDRLNWKYNNETLRAEYNPLVNNCRAGSWIVKKSKTMSLWHKPLLCVLPSPS